MGSDYDPSRQDPEAAIQPLIRYHLSWNPQDRLAVPITGQEPEEGQQTLWNVFSAVGVGSPMPTGLSAGRGSLYLVHCGVPDTKHCAWHIAGDPSIFSECLTLYTVSLLELSPCTDAMQDQSISGGTKPMTWALSSLFYEKY